MTPALSEKLRALDAVVDALRKAATVLAEEYPILARLAVIWASYWADRRDELRGETMSDRPDRESASGLRIPIAKREWLHDGLVSAERTLRLARTGKIPETLLGWMLETSCLRVLRAVYGSDLETAAAIRKHVLEKEHRMQNMEIANG